jgi:hypothetical protein
MDKQEIIERLETCNRALEYAAYNYDGSIIEELDPNVVESTGVGTTCLIEVKNNKELINQLRESQNPSNENGALPIQHVSDTVCPDCNGNGGKKRYRRVFQCTTCKGSGKLDA